QSLRLEIYMRNGRQSVIQTGGPITYWHFEKAGREVAVSFRAAEKAERHVLYDCASGKMLEELEDPADLSQLPQWAKNPGQMQDESVPEGEAYNRARTAWIAKTMRRIAAVKPDMRREDLAKVFSTEGGLSSRLQRTYVYADCPYIKVNVQFKAVGR